MKLYEIDEAIEALVDEETGEIADFDEFERLQMERVAKIENVALYCKNMAARVEALEKEEESFKKRKQAAKNSLKRLKKYLIYATNGQRFESARVKMYSRKSKVVEVDDAFIKWAIEDEPDLLRWKQPEPDKEKIKARIKLGHAVPHAKMGTSTSLIIK